MFKGPNGAGKGDIPRPMSISKKEYDTFFMSTISQKSEILSFLMPNTGEYDNE